jgi:hypothetical protein
MKIILSRKGFDSSAGGVPSPILPDGRLFSLPIPDPRSSIRYRDIQSHGGLAGKLVTDLTGGRIKAASRAHLDPDLRRASLARQQGWRPLFGQSGAAQGHLRNQQIGIGDVFLFFGLFQPVITEAGRFVFDRRCPRQHVIYGWLQIGAIEAVDECPVQVRRWADYHPHFSHPSSVSNTIYLANRQLELDGEEKDDHRGAGQFESISAGRTLTAARAQSPSQWHLPPWFYPAASRPPLTYHANPDRWQQAARHTRLQAASRGQEFVLDCDHYPEAISWLHEIIQRAKAGE